MTTTPFWRRYSRFFGPDPAADVKEELGFHLEAKTEELIRQGLPTEAARKEAERQFGDLRELQRIGQRIAEKNVRRRRLGDYWADLVHDVRFTFRTLVLLLVAVVSGYIPARRASAVNPMKALRNN